MTSELDDLEQAIDVALKVDWALHPGKLKCEDLAQVSRLRNKLDCLDADILTPFDVTLEHRIEGHTSPVDWLKHHTRAKGPDAARRRRLSRRLRHLPAARQAMADGLITGEHVEHLARARDLVGAEVFAFGEEVLVDAAVGQRFCDFVRTVDYFIVRVGTKKPKPEQDHDDRFASSSRTFGGNGVVDAQLEPVGFTIWDAELKRCYEFLLTRDKAEAAERLGRRPMPAELGRTARQRRADAMVLMAERSAAHGDADLPPSRFTLVVHGGAELVGRLIEFLLDDLAAHADDPDHEPDLSDLEYGPDSLHELDDGTVVTVNTLLLALLTGTVRGIYFDPEGVPLRLGRDHRLFGDDIGLAARARFWRCCHAYGCDRTSPGLQTDHVVEWRDGGRSDIENAGPLDPGHNLWKTNHRHDPPRGPTDTGQRRTPPDTGPLPS